MHKKYFLRALFLHKLESHFYHLISLFLILLIFAEKHYKNEVLLEISVINS